jgi:epoxide hydrolase 4
MAATEIRHDRVHADGVTLHVARAGDGPAVVLLHGFPENWRSWRKQISPLVAAGFSVWAPDLRGYNLSERPTARGAYHLRHLVADVSALVRATGSEAAHIVGHDWGGIIGWAFAGRHPEQTRRLVVMNAPHMRPYLATVWRSQQSLRSWYVLFFQLPSLPERVLSAGRFRLIRELFRRTPARHGTFSEDDIDLYVAALARPGALTAALAYYRDNLRGDGLRQAASASIGAETLVIWGDRDPALSTLLLNGLERVVPRLSIHRIPDAGHWVQNEAPDEVNRVLVDFLLGVHRAGTADDGAIG